MRKLLILILGLSLVAAACNKAISVNNEPIAQTAPEVAGLSVEPPVVQQQPEPSSSKPSTNNPKTVPIPEPLPKTTKDSEQDIKLDNLDNRVGEVEKKVENTAPAPAPIPADTTPPNVSLQRMIGLLLSNEWIVKNGGALYGTVGLGYDIVPGGHPDELDKLEYYVDGVLIESSPFRDIKIPWDTTKYENGSHVVMAKVYDKAGNVGTDSASVNVNNNANAGKLCQFQGFGTVVVNRDQTENSTISGYQLWDSSLHIQFGITSGQNMDYTYERVPVGVLKLKIFTGQSTAPSLTGILEACGILTFNLKP